MKFREFIIIVLTAAALCSVAGCLKDIKLKKFIITPTKIEFEYEVPDGNTGEASGTFDANGVAEVNDPRGDGKITLRVDPNKIEPNTVVYVTVDDPIVLQVPTAWTFNGGYWYNSTPESGIITAEPVSSVGPPYQGPFQAEPGMQLLLISSPQNMTNETVDTTAKVSFLHGGVTAGVVLKALDVALAEANDVNGVPVTWLEPTEGLGVDFGSLPLDHSFAIPSTVIVDGFESYTDDSNLLYTWTATGSATACLETMDGHTGNSMKVVCNNTTGRVERTPDDPNWTRDGVEALSIWFKPDPNVDEMFVELVSSNRLYDVNGFPAVDVNSAHWQEWNLELAQFTGVDLTSVTKITLGVTPLAGKSATVYFDDFMLYPPRCFGRQAADLNSDCVVDFKDFAEFADDWVEGGLIWP